MPQITISPTEQSANTTASAINALTETQLAQRWNIAKKTLQAWRLRGGGPKFVRIGTAIRYLTPDVIEYETKNTYDSTSSADCGGR